MAHACTSLTALLLVYLVVTCVYDGHHGRFVHASRISGDDTATKAVKLGPGSGRSRHSRQQMQQRWYCHHLHPFTQPVGAKRVVVRRSLELDLQGNRAAGQTKADVSFVMYVKTDTQDMVGNEIANGGVYEPAQLQQVLRALAQTIPSLTTAAPVFVDVGANLGWYTLNIAASGLAHHVYSFEAMPVNAALLRRSLCDSMHEAPKAAPAAQQGTLGSATAENFLERVTLFGPLALSNFTMECEVVASKMNAQNGYVRCPDIAKHSIHVPDGTNEVLHDRHGTVRTVTLDSVVQREVRVMKIDCEGFEHFVVAGAQQLFVVHKVWYVLLEFNPSFISAAGGSPRELLGLLSSWGYRVSKQGFWGPHFMTSKELQELVGLERGGLDLYFTHEDVLSAVKS
mmetsp:Transcript_16644/g.36013  ORF Transcript_16644/g.36013 Transcript_16644/m.36013 type:complete len:398 (+) Transcript_16644:115-1308(+)